SSPGRSGAKPRGSAGAAAAWADRGSLAVESMLTLPLLLIALFLCASLVYSIHGVLVLDQAAGDACAELAESSYLLQQAWGMGMEAVMENTPLGATGQALASSGLAESLGGYLLASNCLNKHLKDYPAIIGCLEWETTRLPGLAGDSGSDGGDGDGEGGGGVSLGSLLLDEDDVVLVLRFAPAKLNRITSMLPDSWQITITKRERAWLTGRNILPGRGMEQPAGDKDKGPLVYITRWGEKYHVDGCRYLRKSQIPAYLNQLSEAYDGCSVCKPPMRENA
ncbi:MAG: hypothetical protein FWF83_08760, partial [Clostridiales bacterium]|nr:hypothetical protein [Clostridiales bacterium]